MAENKSSQIEKKEPEIDREDFRMLYQITIEDIKFMKIQQWRVTYYVLLLLAGIVGFSYYLDNEAIVYPSQRLILNLLSFAIAIVGTIFLIIFQCSMVKYRKRLEQDIVKKLSEGFRDAISAGLNDPSYTSFTKDFGLVLILILTMLFGAYLLTWLP